MGQCKKEEARLTLSIPHTPPHVADSRAPSACRVGRSANGCCRVYELVTQLSNAIRYFLLLWWRRCCSSDSRSVPSDGVVVNECMEAAKKSGGVVGGSDYYWAWRRAFYYLAVESLVNLRQFDGACQFAGACSGASGTGEYPAAGLERLGSREVNPIYRHCDIIYKVTSIMNKNNEDNRIMMSKKRQMSAPCEMGHSRLQSALRE